MVTAAHAHPSQVATLDDARNCAARIRAWMRDNVMGRDDVIELVLVALFADGHCLLEDYPGSGKTTLTKALGMAIIDDIPDDDIPSFRRIQFTPDLLPSDVTGVTIFETTTNTFQFRRGPVFAYVVLVDEINRTSPKVQSALLEAMAEKQVTVDNKTRALDDLFFVIATQNPLDLAGTFPLPAAQLDRFLFKIRMTHIDRQSELEVLAGYKTHRDKRLPGADLPSVTRSEILDARAVIASIHVAPEVQECLVDIAGETRKSPQILQGASTRSLVLMIPALQARALSRMRSYVSADDVEALAPFIFGHRLELAPGVDDVDSLIRAAMVKPLERLARATMAR
jgi:MoxR-like ATPase